MDDVELQKVAELRQIEEEILSAGNPPLRDRVSVRAVRMRGNLTKVYIRSKMEQRGEVEGEVPEGQP